MAMASQKPVASRVRVVLRVRPFLLSELDSMDNTESTPCMSILNTDRKSNEEITVYLKDQFSSRSECYKLDSFFGQEDIVGSIFGQEVRSVIPGIFHGVNATLFAYGATGSGKTYTMQGTEDEPGLIPLAMSTILSSCKDTAHLVEISYYEIYLDRCYDLLELKAKEIMALEDKDGQVQLKGLSKAAVTSMDEFHEIYSTGVERRKVAHTGLNDVSSRSHAVLTVTVTKGSIKGKLNLIDLAGNEDNRRTHNDGIRLQESAKINQSLFALSNVIYALNNNESRIPYRESKLTRILQDSLGGTSRAVMIACLNPSFYQEAVNTVSLSARSRHVVNYVNSARKIETPKVKVEMEAKLRAWLESKGKRNSIQRISGACSPFKGRTPTSINQSVKSASVCFSSKGTSMSKGRKLFDSVYHTSGHMEKLHISEEAMETQFVADDSRSILLEQGNQEITFPAHNENHVNSSQLFSFWPENSHQVGLPCEYNDCPKSSFIHQDETPDIERNVQNHYNLSNEIKILPDEFDALEGDAAPTRTEVNFLKPPDMSGTPFKEKQSLSPTIMISPVTREGTGQSPRKALSPLCLNIASPSNLSSAGQNCIKLDSRTPESGFKNDARMYETPLHKFDESSSKLKESLVQEYLAFLNVASKDQLMQLKGIGTKRAEYILELREESPDPFKTLSDLENIGLTAKQGHDMFRKAARGIFDC